MWKCHRDGEAYGGLGNSQNYFQNKKKPSNLITLAQIFQPLMSLPQNVSSIYWFNNYMKVYNIYQMLQK